MTVQDDPPGAKVIVAAIAAVAATYFYFLIFAQFGFLQAVQAATAGATGATRPIMAAMGLAGIAGSVLAVRTHAVGRGRAVLAAGFGLCAAAAASALVAGTPRGFLGAAALVGLATGLTTVTLATMLQSAVGMARLGRVIGAGTGLAYGLCNVPPIFTAGAAGQTWLALGATAVGLAAAAGLSAPGAAVKPAGRDYTAPGWMIWLVIFLALVGLDSAAFYSIQHSAPLKSGTWGEAGRLEVNAGVHLVAALLAGWALDRRWLGLTVLAGAGALLAGCGLIGGGADGWDAGVTLYTAGVSVYSVALVYYPAGGARPWLVGCVYAVAGWGGSAAGIGLAEQQHGLPAGMVAGAGGAILLGLAARFLVLRTAANRT